MIPILVTVAVVVVVVALVIREQVRMHAGHAHAAEVLAALDKDATRSTTVPPTPGGESRG